jgi:hypothetical protein
MSSASHSGILVLSVSSGCGIILRLFQCSLSDRTALSARAELLLGRGAAHRFMPLIWYNQYIGGQLEGERMIVV